MSKKLKKFHFVYKTKNKLNGKYYYGMHSTHNLNDGYLGSGKQLRYAIRKYGKVNFELEIIEFFDSRELLIEGEKKIITDEIVKDKDSYNISYGGLGGVQNEEHRRKMREGASKYLKEKWVDLEYREKISEVLRNNMKRNHKLGKINYNTFSGKKHSDDTKLKMSVVKKGKGLKSDNSQWGSKWITNGIESKKVNENEKLPENWFYGRTLKK
jgi:hypothetical protein